MKRILYLTFYFRPDLCAGSFRNSPLVDELAEQTKNRDIEIDVLTTSPNRYSSFREDFKEKETIGNITIERIVVPSHKSGIKDQIFSFKTYFFETLKRTKHRKYDLVFASSSRFFTSYLGYRIAKRNQLPLYLDIRDLFSNTLKNVSKNWFIKHVSAPLIATRERKIYRYASHINLISKGFKEDFSDDFSASFSFFTHGVDPVFKDVKTKRSETDHDYIKNIVYAGNIGDGQGLHKIIPEAAKKLDGFYKFTLIGDGGAKKKLEKRIEQLDVSNVVLKEPVKRNEVIEEYKKADILFIHLNNLQVFRKVLPSKIFELALVEKPILAGVQGYARKFLEEKVDGVFLFNPSDVEGLLQQINNIEKFNENEEQIDNSDFSKEYDRRSINRELSASILSYI